MAGSGFMILCFQSPPQAAAQDARSESWYPAPQQNISKKSEANLGTPPSRKAFQKKHPQSTSKNRRKKGAPKTFSAPQYHQFAAQQTCITSN